MTIRIPHQRKITLAQQPMIQQIYIMGVPAGAKSEGAAMLGRCWLSWLSVVCCGCASSATVVHHAPLPLMSYVSSAVVGCQLVVISHPSLVVAHLLPIVRYPSVVSCCWLSEGECGWMCDWQSDRHVLFDIEQQKKRARDNHWLETDVEERAIRDTTRGRGQEVDSQGKGAIVYDEGRCWRRGMRQGRQVRGQPVW